MSEYRQQCLPEMLKAIREETNGGKNVAFCIMKAVLENMNLTYTDDTKQNALTYLRARVVDHPALKGAGQAVVESVENGICVPSTQDNFEIRREMKFYLCLVRKCVEEMAKST
ncbi:uncharacterized protein [Macrobrachium rosenbergii]|uniref:uncharacterized protein n=1 Tax=Macrobrachium rosenbergii TaxID=79674 RepID=UPI0034D3B57B